MLFFIIFFINFKDNNTKEYHKKNLNKKKSKKFTFSKKKQKDELQIDTTSFNTVFF